MIKRWKGQIDDMYTEKSKIFLSRGAGEIQYAMLRTKIKMINFGSWDRGICKMTIYDDNWESQC